MTKQRPRLLFRALALTMMLHLPLAKRTYAHVILKLTLVDEMMEMPDPAPTEGHTLTVGHTFSEGLNGREGG